MTSALPLGKFEPPTPLKYVARGAIQVAHYIESTNAGLYGANQRTPLETVVIPGPPDPTTGKLKTKGK